MPKNLKPIDQRFDAETASGRFAGVLLITKDDATIYAKAFGLADNGNAIKNTLETRFRFGSVGKLFTEVAVMQLVQAGKLDLDAPIKTYIPDYPNAEITSSVTVADLMAHAGGTGDEFGPVFDAHQAELRTPSDFIRLFGSRGPEFPPGTRQRYSNFGFEILGRIIEEVSGLSYRDYVQRNVFARAGMSSTDNRPEEQCDPRRATPYMTVSGRLVRATVPAVVRLRDTPDAHGYLTYQGGPDGGGFTTANDLLRFVRALKTDELLDPAHTDRLLNGTITLQNGDKTHFDTGGPLKGGGRFIGHNGVSPGSSAQVRAFPDGYAIVILANRDQPLAFDLFDDVVQQLLGANDAPATRPIG
ncbi:serine hydrolase domain-containing protein [Phenylobacterium sp.]|uniref:serine hydrolase domain-containing protein n=1 Tax=Phenylobacterium sp. TaxID=1871053 RepID=UPI0025F4BC44|nr:serine hydrolase domain-containing protein [Phenylobacterium sp.]